MFIKSSSDSNKMYFYLLKKLHLVTLFLAILQTYYLFQEINKFELVGVDDLITITLINQDFLSFIQGLTSGLNVFPPLYFSLAFVLFNIFDSSQKILLGAHIPLLWSGIVLTYLIFKSFSDSQKASFATVILMTVKSSFLTQMIYIRPYCLYYVATLGLLLATIKYQKNQSKGLLFFVWIGFNLLHSLIIMDYPLVC